MVTGARFARQYVGMFRRVALPPYAGPFVRAGLRPGGGRRVPGRRLRVGLAASNRDGAFVTWGHEVGCDVYW